MMLTRVLGYYTSIWRLFQASETGSCDKSPLYNSAMDFFIPFFTTESTLKKNWKRSFLYIPYFGTKEWINFI